MRFSKWHALGNSYLLVERAELADALSPDEARRLCDPDHGVGADGVRGDADELGDANIVDVLEVAQHEDGPLGAWEPRQHRP